MMMMMYYKINNKDTYGLYDFIKVLSRFLIIVLVSGWNWWMNLPKLSRALLNLSYAINRGLLASVKNVFKRVLKFCWFL